jgi:hypothetical protein
MVSLIHFILLFTRLSLMHSVVLHWIVHGTYKSTAGGNGSLVDDFLWSWAIVYNTVPLRVSQTRQKNAA